MGKEFKIWGVSYGIMGDTIMGLPVLKYFEKKYPNSFKYWGIEKKCAFTTELFLNQPLIDQVVISTVDEGFSDDCYRDIIDKCQVKCTTKNWKHSRPDWYNYYTQVEETAIIAGITDIHDVLNKEEMIPNLHRYFDIGNYKDTIAIWPFSSDAIDRGNRCPSRMWWTKMIDVISGMGYKVFHFGLHTEPCCSSLPTYKEYTFLSFFEQVKLSLGCK
jgi:hypothetical protein